MSRDVQLVIAFPQSHSMEIETWEEEFGRQIAFTVALQSTRQWWTCGWVSNESDATVDCCSGETFETDNMLQKKLAATSPDCLFVQHIFKFNNTKCTWKHVAMLIGAKRFPLAALLSSLYGHLKSLIDRKTIASFLPFSFRLFPNISSWHDDRQ